MVTDGGSAIRLCEATPGTIVRHPSEFHRDTLPRTLSSPKRHWACLMAKQGFCRLMRVCCAVSCSNQMVSLHSLDLTVRFVSPQPHSQPNSIDCTRYPLVRMFDVMAALSPDRMPPAKQANSKPQAAVLACPAKARLEQNSPPSQND